MIDEPKIMIEIYGNIIRRSMINRWFPHLFLSLKLSINEILKRSRKSWTIAQWDRMLYFWTKFYWHVKCWTIPMELWSKHSGGCALIQSSSINLKKFVNIFLQTIRLNNVFLSSKKNLLFPKWTAPIDSMWKMCLKHFSTRKENRGITYYYSNGKLLHQFVQVNLVATCS